ncbi:Threonine aldolase [Kickxella alabastrina]|uniref:Threonine aldolase n=1 Tax=Kickxella alabastrina TaxID=61397 RepID=A0ACC1IEF3_9FUNG|nr:Threonine aldolase [Kickxella alabastrina]
MPTKASSEPRNWDLRSDTVTKPNSAMLSAMLSAPVGDDVFGEDPTVAALEARVASLCNKPAALFCASSTMANQLAIRTHMRDPPESLVCHTDAHVFAYESGGASLLSQTQMIPVKPSEGHNLQLADVQRVFINNNQLGHCAPTHLVALENTMAGVIMPVEDMREISAFAREHGAKLHLDGSRLWNASVASGIAISEYAGLVDTLNLCLSKGMGCPVGAVLVGSEQFIGKARHFRKVFGGGWRQAGVLAAAGLHAIDHVWPTMADTHRLARRLADGLSKCGFEIALPVDTNMVLVRAPSAVPDAQRIFVEAALEKGVKLVTIYGNVLRIVLHHQIDGNCIDVLLETATTCFGNV